MAHDSSEHSSVKLIVSIIILLVGFYIIATVAGLPQTATRMIVEHERHSEVETEHAASVKPETGDPAHAEAVQSGEGRHGAAHPAPPIWMVLPFALLLVAIAVMPLIRFTQHWWDSNLHRFYVAAFLGVLTLAYYLVLHPYPLESHWPAHSVVTPTEGQTLQPLLTWTVFSNAMLHEYVPFIVLLFTLYTISGGIRIEGNLRPTSLTNVTFIGIGGLLASVVGTTGAAMLLIRPLLETNQSRQQVYHTVLFFIFVVCNCGGLLLPIGDPPLFLGYLRGVPFLWTLNLWAPWLFVNATLLVIYFLWDRLIVIPREVKPGNPSRGDAGTRGLTIRGLGVNGLLLVCVLVSVAMLGPTKALPGTDWHPWLYLREIVQLGLVGLSLLFSSPSVRLANRFNYHAIIEVAALFFGIFICMQPALHILGANGEQLTRDLNINTPFAFFWITGALSSVLDNAPTYVVFFETAKTVTSSSSGAVAGVDPKLLAAVSLGAVFMGAMTYIGNGPNFMVKAIAEKHGVRMPSFFGYIFFSVLILLPVLFAAAMIFL